MEGIWLIVANDCHGIADPALSLSGDEHRTSMRAIAEEGLCEEVRKA